MKLQGKPVINVGINKNGIDYIVSDIHGCYDKLMQKLGSINFDFSKDRLFSVGDIIDRGEDSLKCFGLLNNSWFYSVRGNHCQFAIDYTKENPPNSWVYIQNGGYWFCDLPKEDQSYIAEQLDKLPWVIRLKTANGIIGIVHSQPVRIDGKYNWQKFIKAIKDNAIQHNCNSVRELCTWERKIVLDENELKGDIQGVLAVVGGHTPVPEPVRQYNYFAIDTGACYNPEPDGYGYFTLLRADTLEFI